MFEGYIILLFICLSVYLVNKKKLPSYFIYSGLLVFVALLVELIKCYLDFHTLHDEPVGHVYQLLEVWLVLLTYYHFFSKAALKKAIVFLLIILTPLYFFISVYYEGILNDCVLSFSINSCIYIAFSLIFFYDLYTKGHSTNILNYGFFWINCGNLIYACGTFFQMSLTSYIGNIDKGLKDELDIINHILNYFLYATYTVGFLCTTKKSK